MDKWRQRWHPFPWWHSISNHDWYKSHRRGCKTAAEAQSYQSLWSWPTTTRILKELAHELAPYLIIFQNGLDTGRVPKDWRSFIVTAIFKKGEKYRPSNYQPVSLTCICCKIQEHILTSNILKHLVEHHILTDCQHRFRARRSCEMQLLALALIRDNSMSSLCWTSPRHLTMCPMNIFYENWITTV